MRESDRPTDAQVDVERDARESLLAEHGRLLAEISALRQWCSEVGETGRPRFGEMGSRVRMLRRRLTKHFAMEEHGGYLAEALAVAPQFTREAAELRGQHRELLDGLDRLTDGLAAVEPPFQGWQDACRQLNDILNHLRDHEAAENRIVQAAVEDDLGPGE
ncbi:MAG TPA: hemerythrin domain-containing protein [Planctomycetaceae bacterium]|nr:hemerythrin domain-containing protein [Planctomycetaceae bacterium]